MPIVQASVPPHRRQTRLGYGRRNFERNGKTFVRSLRLVKRLISAAQAKGGLYDHLGGGFARYSTDEKWLIPRKAHHLARTTS